MARHRPSAPKVVVSREKVGEGPLEKKKQELSGVRKAIETDPAWSWLLLGNSNFLNRDVGITVFILWFASLCSCFPICLSN
jgi:hypothetical protein